MRKSAIRNFGHENTRLRSNPIQISDTFQQKQFQELYKLRKGWRPSYPTYKKGIDNDFSTKYIPRVNMNISMQESYTRDYENMREKAYSKLLDHELRGDSMAMRQEHVPRTSIGKIGKYNEKEIGLDKLTGIKFRSGANRSLSYKSHKYLADYAQEGYKTVSRFQDKFGNQRAKPDKIHQQSWSGYNPFIRRHYEPRMMTPGEIPKTVVNLVKPSMYNPEPKPKNLHIPTTDAPIVGNNKELFHSNPMNNKPSKFFQPRNMNMRRIQNPKTYNKTFKSKKLYTVTKEPRIKMTSRMRDGNRQPVRVARALNIKRLPYGLRPTRSSFMKAKNWNRRTTKNVNL